MHNEDEIYYFDNIINELEISNILKLYELKLIPEEELISFINKKKGIIKNKDTTYDY